MNKFGLFCKSCLILFLPLTMALRFYAAPSRIYGLFGVVLGIIGVAFATVLAGHKACFEGNLATSVRKANFVVKVVV